MLATAIPEMAVVVPVTSAVVCNMAAEAIVAVGVEDTMEVEAATPAVEVATIVAEAATHIRAAAAVAADTIASSQN